MANYANLLATIAANIYTNNNNEVTAAMVKTAVDQMVASLGAGYQFMSVATPATNPGTPDAKVFYIASTPGTYSNFLDAASNPLEVNNGEVAILKGSGTTWSKEVCDFSKANIIGPAGWKTGARYTTNLGWQAGELAYSAPISPGDVVTASAFCPTNSYAIAFFNGGTFLSGVAGTSALSVQSAVAPAGANIVSISGLSAYQNDSWIYIRSGESLHERVSDLEVQAAGYDFADIANRFYISQVGNDGTITYPASSPTRAICKQPLHKSATFVSADKPIARIVFFSQEPDGSSAGFVSYKDGISAGAKVAVPATATWAVIDMALTNLGGAVRLRMDGDALSARVGEIEGENIGGDFVDYIGRRLPIMVASDGSFAATNGTRSTFLVNVEGATELICEGGQVARAAWYSDKPDLTTSAHFISLVDISYFATNEKPWSVPVPAGAKWIAVDGTDALNDAHIYVRLNRETISKAAYDSRVIGSAGSWMNNSIGEQMFAAGERSRLKILAFGNSFMRNSCWYLSQIAKNGCGVNLTVGNLYTGGTNLYNHYAAVRNGSAVYEYAKITDGAIVTNVNGKTAKYGLLDERWDVVILHQYLPWAQPYEPFLSLLIGQICDILGYCPKFYINATWAGSVDNNATYYGYATEQDMLDAVWMYAKQAVKDSGVLNVIPTGTAIQNARTLSYANAYNRFVNASPDFHHLNPAGGFIAACTLFEKIVTPLNGVHCSDTTFRITATTSLPPETTTQPGILVTDSNYLSMCQCAIDAVSDPWSVTNQ